MPWTREGSRLTLLLEGVSDPRFWRMIWFCVAQALSTMDLGRVKALALNKIVSKLGYNHVTVFIDLDRKQKPVIFVTPQYRRDGLRHIASLPSRHRRKLPRRQRHQ
ncbi:hypothetical protein DFAR_2090002 [Desulfarculales bacterium]